MTTVQNLAEQLDLDYFNVIENRIVAGCPFKTHEHDFERPGFSIFLDTGHWICFKGCGQGEMQELVAYVKEISNKDARKFIQKYSKLDIDGIIAKLANRTDFKTGESSINYFELDYNQQDKTKTSSYILGRGFTQDTIIDWGVRIDPVLHCLVIPIYSITGELVGLVRREVPGWELPTKSKYWYSPGFSCADHLFGANKHSPKGSTILVEGPLDAMWLHQMGYTNAVAILGAYCSPAQQRLLTKLGNRVIVALDNDSAGQEATKRTLKDLAGKFILNTVEWPEKDPQTCTKKEIDAAIWKSL